MEPHINTGLHNASDRLKKIKLLLLDVDGVMTDGRIIVSDDGSETKAFDVTDGHGIKLLQRSGIEVGIVTGRVSKVVEHRAIELGITELHQGAKNKITVVREIIARKNLTPDDVGYMGDDLIDLPVLTQVGFSACPKNADFEVKERVNWVIDHEGGRGAVRKLCEMILKANGRWDEVTTRYFNPEPL